MAQAVGAQWDAAWAVSLRSTAHAASHWNNRTRILVFSKLDK